ncbi:sugar ABC transporter permease, partial [Streptomyces tricolor]
MTLPVVLLLLVFNYVPILGNVVAFQDYDPYLSDNGFVAVFQSPWVGFEQFQRVFDDPEFWHAVQNTFVLFLLQLVLFFPVPIALALLINSVIRPRVRAVAQAIMYLPHFFSWVLVVTVFQQIFGGAGGGGGAGPRGG